MTESDVGDDDAKRPRAATPLSSSPNRLAAPPRHLSLRRRLRILAASVATFALVSLLLDDPSKGPYGTALLRGLRRAEETARRGLGCADTPYVKVRDVLTMPAVTLPRERMDPPSHVTLCVEYIKRRNAKPVRQGRMETNPLEGDALLSSTVTVHEDAAVCSDWEAPHHSVMQLFASALIASKAKDLGIAYHHNCHQHRPPTPGKQSDYDYTSVQQLLPNMLITPDETEAVDDAILENLCRGCVEEHKTVLPPLYSYSSASRQCLLFPGGQQSASSSQTALAAVLPTIKERLRRAAEDHLPHTTSQFVPVEVEAKSGCIIFIDDTASLMHYSVYDKHIPNECTHIQIFASASCALASVSVGNSCVEHGRRIKQYFLQTRAPHGVYVRYDVVASTAASYARMIQARLLLCPPGCVSCLLPVLAKAEGTSAVIAEASSILNTKDWFEHIAATMEQLKDLLDVDLDIVKLSSGEQEMPTEVIGEFGPSVFASARTGDEKKEEPTGGNMALSYNLLGSGGGAPVMPSLSLLPAAGARSDFGPPPPPTPPISDEIFSSGMIQGWFTQGGEMFSQAAGTPSIVTNPNSAPGSGGTRESGLVLGTALSYGGGGSAMGTTAEAEQNLVSGSGKGDNGDQASVDAGRASKPGYDVPIPDMEPIAWGEEEGNIVSTAGPPVWEDGYGNMGGGKDDETPVPEPPTWEDGYGNIGSEGSDGPQFVSARTDEDSYTGWDEYGTTGVSAVDGEESDATLPASTGDEGDYGGEVDEDPPGGGPTWTDGYGNAGVGVVTKEAKIWEPRTPPVENWDEVPNHDGPEWVDGYGNKGLGHPGDGTDGPTASQGPGDRLRNLVSKARKGPQKKGKEPNTQASLSGNKMQYQEPVGSERGTAEGGLPPGMENPRTKTKPVSADVKSNTKASGMRGLMHSILGSPNNQAQDGSRPIVKTRRVEETYIK